MKKTGHKKSFTRFIRFIKCTKFIKCIRCIRFIRYEALGSIALLFLTLTLIVTFLLEPILEYGVELAGYRGVGSEVNVGKIDIDWSKPALNLYNLQVTDHNDPMRNLLQIDKINITLSWESLLRLSLTSETSSVEGIMIHSKRKSPGKVMSKDKRLLRIGSKTTNKVINSLQKKSNNDLLTQALSIAQGKKNNKQALEDLKNQLATKKISQELENKVESLKKDWKSFKSTGLEGEKTKKIIKEVENFKFESDKGTSELIQSIGEAKALLKKAKFHYKNLKSEIKSLKNQSKDLKEKMSKTPEFFIEDLNYMANTLGSDSLNPNQLTTSMLSSYIAIQLENFNLVRDNIQKQLLKDVNSYSPVDIEKIAPPIKSKKPLNENENEIKNEIENENENENEIKNENEK